MLEYILSGILLSCEYPTFKLYNRLNLNEKAETSKFWWSISFLFVLIAMGLLLASAYFTPGVLIVLYFVLCGVSIYALVSTIRERDRDDLSTKLKITMIVYWAFVSALFLLGCIIYLFF